jgi:endonuclease/exonuclease/phosphatase family metal-dependent hydrolase
MENMKSLKLLILLTCVIFGCAKKHTPTASVNNSGQNPGKGSGLKILSYNIHHANPPSKPNLIDIDAIAKVINDQAPDLVALQEIDVHTDRSGKSLHEAEELGLKTGLKVYFAKSINYGGGEYGVAILSKYPLEETKSYQLPTAAGTNGEPRILATATVNLTPEKKIVFACTHLDAQRNDTNKLLQIKMIAEILKKETLPVIIAGDLNAVPGSAVINVLDSYFMRSCVTGCGFTIPEKNPNKTIDFIAFSPKSKFRVVSHKVINEPYASDHLPVFTELEWR